MDPRLSFSGVDLVFTGFVFLLWFSSLIGGGAGIAALLERGTGAPKQSNRARTCFELLEWATFRLALGTLVAVLLVAFFGTLGMLGAKWKSLWWSLLVLGLVLLWRELPRVSVRKRLSERRFTAFDIAVLSLFCSYFALRFFVASFPSAHGDALLYHLVGPRLWHQLGSIQLAPDLPNALIANSWEYLYVWPVELITRAEPFTDLLCAQIFSQWTHLLVGGFGTALFLFLFLRPMVPEGSVVLLAVIAGIFSSSLQWTIGIAKNDWGVVFWFFSGLYCFRLALEQERRRWLAVGAMFWGLALVAKLNAALVILPMLGLLLIRCRRCPRLGALRALLAILPSLAATATIILVRNWQETGSPFFPMFQTWWPSPWVSESWHAHIASNQPKQKVFNLGIFLQRALDLAKEGYGGIAALLATLALLVPRSRMGILKKPRVLNSEFSLSFWFGAGFLSWVLFVLSVGDDQELRYLGAGILLLSSAGVLLLWNLLLSWGPSPSRKIFLWGSLLVLAATSRLPLHVLGPKHWPKSGIAAVDAMSGGDAKLWLRKNAKAEERIIFVADNETYYLVDHPVTILTEKPDLDRATRQEITLNRWLAGVENTVVNARYVLDTRPELGMSLRFNSVSDRERLANATVFQGRTARVLDLKRL